MAGKLKERDFDVWVDGKKRDLKIVRPSFKVGNQADRYYKKAFADAIRDGIPTAFQFREELSENEYHGKVSDKIAEIDIQLSDLEAEIDDLGDDKIEEGKKVVEKMQELRGHRILESFKINSIYENTAESYAENIRNQFYAAELTYDVSGKKVWASFEDFLDEESDILAQTAISTVMLFNAKIASNYQMDFAENKWRLARGLINEKGESIEVDEDGNETVIGEESDSDTGVIKGEENPPKEKKTVKVKGKKKGGVPKKEPATAVK
jgi:hypothetical protein